MYKHEKILFSGQISKFNFLTLYACHMQWIKQRSVFAWYRSKVIRGQQVTHWNFYQFIFTLMLSCLEEVVISNIVANKTTTFKYRRKQRNFEICSSLFLDLRRGHTTSLCDTHCMVGSRFAETMLSFQKSRLTFLSKNCCMQIKPFH